MANRFNRIPTPADLNGVNLYQPNFQLLTGVLEQQQNVFDLGLQASEKTFGSLGSDDERRGELLQGQQEAYSEVVNTFKTKGIEAGNQRLDDFMRMMRQGYSPGGEAYQINANREAYQKYAESIDKLYEEGKLKDINTVNYLKGQSLSNFGGTNYDANTGTYQNFSGMTPAHWMDYSTTMSDLVKDWKMTALTRDGSRVEDWVLKPNGYVHVKTGKVVPYSELRTHLDRVVSERPDIQQFLKQETNAALYSQGITAETLGDAELYGKIVDEIYTNKKNVGIEFAASKYSRVEYDDHFLKNWQAAINYQSRKDMELARYKYKLEVEAENIYTVNEGQEVYAPSGTTVSEVENYKKSAKDLQLTALGNLSSMVGFNTALADYNNQADPNNQLDPANPEQIYEALKTGMLTLPDDVSPGVINRELAALEEGIRQERIADARMKSAEQQYLNTLTEQEKAKYQDYRSKQLELAEQELVKTRNSPTVRFSASQADLEVAYNESKNLTPEEMIALGEGRKVTRIVDGNEVVYSADNYGMSKGTVTASVNGGSSKVVTGIGVTNIAELADDNNKYSSKAASFKNNILGKPRVKDLEMSNVYGQLMSPEQLGAERKALEKYTNTEGIANTLIPNAANLTAQEKVDLQASNLKIVGTPFIEHGFTNGQRHWVMNMSVTDANGNKTTKKIMVPTSVLYTDGTVEEENTRNSRVVRTYSNIYDNAINTPIEDPSMPGVLWEVNNKGDVYVTSPSGKKTRYTTEEAVNVVAQEQQLADNLAMARVTRESYDTYIYPNLILYALDENITPSGLVARGRQLGLSPAQTSAILYGDPSVLQRTDQKQQVPPLPYSQYVK